MTKEQTDALHAETQRYLMAYAQTLNRSNERAIVDAEHRERVRNIIVGKRAKRGVMCDPFCDPSAAKRHFG